MAPELRQRRGDATPARLAYLVTVLVAGVVFLLCTVEIPKPAESVVYMLSAQIVTAWGTILGRWFSAEDNTNKAHLRTAPQPRGPENAD